MKILVVGAGSIGLRHMKNLRILGVEELLVCRTLRGAKKIDLDSEIPIYTNLEEALDQKPDGVIVSNPSSLHLETTKAIIKRGVHVYLEKPVSHNLEGTDDLVRLSRKNRAEVLVGCQFRFHPNLRAIEKWLEKGALGKLLSVQMDMGSYLPDWHPWEDYSKSYASRKDLGGGVILTLIHELDYMYWLFGQMERIYAMGGKRTPLDVDVEDTALISALGISGLPIQLRMDYWRKPPVRKMNIVGEEGEINWDYFTGEAHLLKEGKVVNKNVLPQGWERNYLFLDMMRHFLEVIRGEAKSMIPLEEGVEVLKMALMAKDSLATKEVMYSS